MTSRTVFHEIDKKGVYKLWSLSVTVDCPFLINSLNINPGSVCFTVVSKERFCKDLR